MQAIQFSISPEQVAYARSLVDYSIENHTVHNSWRDASQTFRYRFAGTLCEVIFADLYSLPRPARAFGANGGQDYGRDHIIAGKVIDIKGRLLDTPKLYNFCINAWQVERETCKTDYYYFMQCYPIENPQTCLLLGKAGHADVKEERVSTRRNKGDAKGTVIWDNDVFDVSLQKLHPVKLPPNAATIPNLKIVQLNYI